MNKLTAYDVFIGIFKNFPESKKDFRYEKDELIDFICQRRDDYSILREFTREDIYYGLENLGVCGMLTWNTATPDMREFSPGAIKSSFTQFNKKDLFGKKGLEEVKDLSKKFVERFS